MLISSDKPNNKIYKTLIAGCIGLFFFICTSCARKPSDVPIATVNDLAFDTIIRISVYENSPEHALSDETVNAALAQALLMCKEYDALFSKTMEGSDIYRINHANGAAQKVSPETILLLKDALYYSELTNGKIDITVSKAKELWDFSTQEENAPASRIPDEARIKDALSHVDYHNIILDETENTVQLTDPDAELDLGFIAKGYIADRLKEYLTGKGIEHAIINLGGNVLTIGTKPDGTSYTVGIEKPFDTKNYIDKVSVSDKSVVTSGIYQRFFQSDGIVYHHILDPSTGFPVQTDLLSATIIADSSTKADALSTVCILLGSSDAKKLIETDDTVSAILITDSYDIIKVNCN